MENAEPLSLDARQRAMLLEMGVRVWLPERVPAPQALPAPAAAAAAATPVLPHERTAAEAAAEASRVLLPAHASPSERWSALALDVTQCRACAMCAGRRNVTLQALPPEVPQADWLVLGDPPDEDEERNASPFAGPAGVLLDNMLRALDVQRANVPQGSARAAAAGARSAARSAYVSNVLKCRPAHGAIPQAAELQHCARHLHAEISLVRPKIILALGRFATQLVLGGAEHALGRVRGKVHAYAGIPVVVTYPPAVLLRKPADKARAWVDLCQAAAHLQSAAGGAAAD